MENYRGITVSATFGKLSEYTVLNKMKYGQLDLQFGFTKGLLLKKRVCSLGANSFL